MAYVKQNWECGETITADKLNHMEDGIAAGGDCDCGFECTETVTTLTEESVTTTAQGNYNMGTLQYSQLIDADSITVTFDGVEYECPRVTERVGNVYGGAGQGDPDFSEYPFVIMSTAERNGITTQTAGTHTVKIEIVGETITTTLCFEKAVDSLIASIKPMILKADNTENPGEVMLDHTWQEILTAFVQGRNIVVINRAEGAMFENVVSIDHVVDYHVYTVQGNTLRTYSASSTDLHPAYGGK